MVNLKCYQKVLKARKPIKKVMKYFLLLSLVLLSIPAFAQIVDKVVIATDITSVDALVAKAAGEKTGAPVLIAENGVLTAESKDQLLSLGAKTVILVGGPQVIKPAVADELQSLGYTVVRLWGIERTGTAIEVAKYFWSTSNCAVLVDDTKNSDVDTDLQAPASTLASESGCLLIPIPQGSLPGEVLALLDDSNVSVVKMVARASPDTSQLARFNLKLFVGDKKKVETDVENETETNAAKEGKKLKLVIVATPSWKQALAIGAHPSDRSVVRFVSDVSGVPELITKIKEKNITDVHVVGIPSLAQQIAKLLTDANITVKVVSGEKATAIGKALLEEFKDQWAEKKRLSSNFFPPSNVKEHLLQMLNETEAALNDQEIELASLKADGVDTAKIAEIQAMVDDARNKLTSIRTLILELNVDRANVQLSNILSVINGKKWMYRTEINGVRLLDIKAKLAEEEQKNDERTRMVDEKIAAIEGKLSALKQRCGNATSVEDLVAKAKSLREEARKAVQSGDNGKASSFMLAVQRLVETAHNLGNVCERESKLSNGLQMVVEKRLGMTKPSLEIVSPKDGENITGSSLTVTVRLANFTIKPMASTFTSLVFTAYLHYYLDAKEMVSPETTVTFTNVTSGSHVVRVELRNNDHSLLTPPVVKSVTITTTTGTTAPTPTPATSITGNPIPITSTGGIFDSHPDIYDSKVVFARYGPWQEGGTTINNYETYVYDITAGTETRLTPTAVRELDQGVYGNKVVYSRYVSSDYQTYLYDLSTGTETLLAGGARPKDISDNIVVYADSGGVKYANYATGESKVVDASGESPRTHGNKIVYRKRIGPTSTSTTTSVNVYDILTGASKEIVATTSLYTYSPDIYGDIVVFQYNASGPLYTYNLTNGVTQQIVPATFSGNGDWERPVIYKNIIAYVGPNRFIYWYDINKKQVTAIPRLTEVWHTQPDVYENKIVYTAQLRAGADDSRIYMYTIP